jgi:rhodanese-related sulfurtransferase
MTKKFKKGIQDLVAEAEAAIETISLKDAIARHGSDDLMFVDVRDIRELERDGMIPGAYHVPYVLYCAAAWRSALTAKTLKDMGMENVVQFADGFKAWKEAGGPVGEKERKDA